MLTKPKPPRIDLPKAWQACVKSAALYTIALVIRAKYTSHSQGLSFNGSTRGFQHPLKP